MSLFRKIIPFTKHSTKKIFHLIEVPSTIGMCLLVIFTIIRLLELASNTKGTLGTDALHYAKGLKYDLLFAALISWALTIPSILVVNKSAQIKTVFIYILTAIIAIPTWFLSEYFLLTGTPLNQSVLIYSISDAWLIAKASVTVNSLQIIRFTTIATALILVPILIRLMRSKTPKAFAIASVALMCSPLANRRITPNISEHADNITYYQEVNKASYLTKSIIVHYGSTERLATSDFYAKSCSYQNRFAGKRFVTPSIPFVAETDTSNVLGKFFALKENAPNIVIIVVESLSRRLSGPNAQLGSFTPFLDSLASNGLFWSNFISTSERTFQALPSILASAPYGAKGFMDIEKERTYPKLLSLPQILKEHGYSSHFYYGGWSSFDHMKPFLNQNGFEFILDDKKFNPEYTRIPSSSDGFSWGYPDDALFNRALVARDSIGHTPTLEVFLTLSMHDPYSPPNTGYWISRLKNHVNKMNPNSTLRQTFRSKAIPLATMLYTDNAIRNLFKGMKQQTGYNNTIFIICGDHNIGIGSYSLIEKYTVPLIIYSPLLKEHKNFPAVSATADITPTILNLLSSKYAINLPKTTHWLGAPLDTCSTFRCNRFVPFMRVDRTINEMVYDSLFFSEDRVFAIDRNLKLTQINNTNKQKELRALLEEFILLNKFVCENDMLYPINLK